MSRGFGATLGSATTDRVKSSVIVPMTVARTWLFWTWRNGEGGSGAGRVFAHGSTATQFINSAAATGTYIFQRQWGTTVGDWRFTSPSASVWHHIAVVYDGASTANDPVIYVDGSSVSVTRNTAPAGTIDTGSGSLLVGNRDTTFDRVWDGLIAEFAYWDALLNANEVAALARGVGPRRIRHSTTSGLNWYLPLYGTHSPEPSFGASSLLLTGTVTGTAKQNHAPILPFSQGWWNAPTQYVVANGLLLRRRKALL